MPQPASALSPQSDPINSKTASVVHPREWMPCPSCPLWSRAPKTRHFTSYKQATDHELRTAPNAPGLTLLNASPRLRVRLRHSFTRTCNGQFFGWRALAAVFLRYGQLEGRRYR